MRGMNTRSSQKRQCKSRESEIIIPVNVIIDNPGVRSPKASPRRIPKKRKSRPSFRVPTCKKLVDFPALQEKTQIDLTETKAEDSQDQDSKLDKVTSKELGTKETQSNTRDNDEVKIIHVIESDILKEENKSENNVEKPDVEAKETLDDNTENKTFDDDEGYYDLSFIEPEKPREEPSVDKSTSTPLPSETSDAATEIDNLNIEFKQKLCITASVQTDDSSEPKKRRLNKSCQITDTAAETLNTKLEHMRDKVNRHQLEADNLTVKNKSLEKRCSSLNTERLSLSAQTEALQHECVKEMYQNNKMKQRVNQKECHILTLKETLLSCDKELSLLHKQTKTTSNTAIQINEYREMELIRVDNIRLLHDNRALTASLDSLNAQLCALRRISRNYDECSDSVILMNKRLAEDNTLISANLSAIKKELKSVNQEHQESLNEVKYLRSSLKRSSTERDTGEAGTGPDKEHEGLVRRNEELRHTVELLREEVESLHTELNSTRSAHLAFDKVLEEKCDLQKQLHDIEERNGELWDHIEDLRTDNTVLYEENSLQKHENNILKGENDELKDLNDSMVERVKVLEKNLQDEVEKNAQLSSKITELSTSLNDSNISMSDLHTTMEFLQVEHSFIQSDVEKKDVMIKNITSELEELKKSKEELVNKCKGKLREKTRKLNASRIKLGYALLEMRDLNSHGSSSE